MEWCQHFRADMWVVGNMSWRWGTQRFGRDHWLNSSEKRGKVCWEEGVREKDRDREVNLAKPQHTSCGTSSAGCRAPKRPCDVILNSSGCSSPLRANSIQEVQRQL